MIKNDKLRAYIKENFYMSNKEIGEVWGVSGDLVRALRNRMKKQGVLQEVKTPEGYKGKLIRGKTWQLHDGSWRESLTFEVDNIEQWIKFKEEFLKDLHTLGDLQKPVKLKKTGTNNVCLEISLPDAHFGKGDIKELSDLYIKCIFDLLEKAEKFKVEKILLPIGNDGLNSEGKRKTTTGGTPQEDSVHWQDSFRYYWTTVTAVIRVLASTYPVDIIIVPGNHDTERMFYIGEVLNAYFRNFDTVTIDNTGEYRKYYEYGKNMLLFTHGDKEKHTTLPLLMATEQPEMFARTKFREAHLGHFHKEMQNEYCGIKTRFLPSICTTDEWHKMMGYNHLRAAQAYMWNKEEGLEGYFQISLL